MENTDRPDFDVQHYGQDILARPDTLPEVAAIWSRAHPESGIQGFYLWVREITGRDLFDMLSEAETLRLYDAMAEQENDPIVAMSVLEGIGSGP